MDAERYVQFLMEAALAYLRIVAAKHGVTPVASEDLVKMSKDDLVSVLDTLRDLAHLPPR